MRRIRDQTPDRECNDRTRKNTESRELARLPEGDEQRPLSLQPSFLVFSSSLSLSNVTLCFTLKGKYTHASYLCREKE